MDRHYHYQKRPLRDVSSEKDYNTGSLPDLAVYKRLSVPVPIGIFVFCQVRRLLVARQSLIDASRPGKTRYLHCKQNTSIMSQVIVITGASSGSAICLPKPSPKPFTIVYAGMRDPTPGNASVKDIESFIEKDKVDIRPVPLNVVSEESLTAGIDKVLKEAGKIDVLIHNARH